jgi:hypothetical protein
VEVVAHKVLLLYQALQALLSGVVVLAVEVERRHQPAIEAVADQFLAAAAVVAVGHLLLLLNVVLAVGLQHTLVISV